MTGWMWLSAAAAGLAAVLMVRPRPSLLGVTGALAAPSVEQPEATWWMMRFRLVLAPAVGVGAWVFVGGAPGAVAAVLGGAGAWVWIGRAEPESVRRRREAIAADLPVLVGLLRSGVAAGLSPIAAISAACAALPGPAAAQLSIAIAPVGLGADPGEVWRSVAALPGLAPLGRALVRAHESGAGIVPVIGRLAEELGRERRAEIEDRARRVGVRAAVPLGVCLLPAFLLLGIAPVVGGLIGSLGL